MPEFNFTVALRNQASTEARKLSSDIKTLTKELSGIGDKGSKEALKLELALRKAETAAVNTTNKLYKLNSELSKMGQNNSSVFEGMAGTATKFGFVIGSIAGAVALATRELIKFGNVSLKAFGERESQITAYRSLFKGDLGQAELQYGRAQAIGEKTNLTSAEVLKAQQALFTGGIHGAEADKMLAGGLDLATAAPDNERKQRLDSYTRAIRQIVGKGKLQSEELTGQLGEAGLNTSFVKEAIAQGRGFKGKNQKDISDFAEKLLRNGDVGSDEGLRAIRLALSKQFNNGGKLGGFATEQAGTIASLQSNRDEAFDKIQKSYNAEMLPSVKVYKDALKSSTKALDVNTVQGNNFRTVLADLANTSIGLKAAWESFTTGFFEGFSKSYTSTLEKMGVTSEGLSNGLTTLTTQMVTLGNWIGDNLGPGVARLTHMLDSLGNEFHIIGLYLSGDVKKGWEARKFANTVSAANERLIERKFGDKSDADPKKSRDQAKAEMERFGTNEGVGKGGGAVSLDGEVRDGFGNIIKRAAPARIAVGKKRGSGDSGTGGSAGGAGESGGAVIHGGGIKIGTMHLEMHLHGNSWDEVKHIIASEATGEVKQLFEKLATEMGV